MLIPPAYAQGAGAPGAGGLEMFIPFILIIVVFYFLIFRPQQKKAKQHREMLANLRRGDRIVTGGGIVGRIARLEGDKELIVEISPDIRVRIMRSTVAELLSHGEPAERPSEGEAAPEPKAAKSASGGKKRTTRRKPAERKQG